MPTWAWGGYTGLKKIHPIVMTEVVHTSTNIELFLHSTFDNLF